MTSLKESLERAAQEWTSIEPTSPQVLRLGSDIEEWANKFIGELEEYMKADQRWFDHPDERGYRCAVQSMLKFLKGEI